MTGQRDSDSDDVQRRIKERYGINLTTEQLNALRAEWFNLVSDAILAVKDADSRAMPGWAIDILTGEVRVLLTPEQEEAREQLRRVAQETLQRLVNRHRDGENPGT
jgi:hypothetical protein